MVCFVDASFLMKVFQMWENLNCGSHVLRGELMRVVLPSTVIIKIRMVGVGIANFRSVFIVVVIHLNHLYAYFCATKIRLIQVIG